MLAPHPGIHPRFSQDGTKIIFVSYRDNPQGDIYLVDAAGGNEKRVTSSAGLKIYPTFGATNNEIMYTLIDRDTNRDGRIDFRDNSTIFFADITCWKSPRTGIS